MPDINIKAASSSSSCDNMNCGLRNFRTNTIAVKAKKLNRGGADDLTCNLFRKGIMNALEA
jgi:hypothetical protein